jgi:hypothetical protein
MVRTQACILERRNLVQRNNIVVQLRGTALQHTVLPFSWAQIQSAILLIKAKK